MGIFSSSDIVSVFANTYHLVEANETALQDAVVYAVLSGTSISASILNVTSNQMNMKVDAFRSYAIDNYSLGLPQASYEESLEFQEQDVIDAISADTDRTYSVVLNFHYVAPLIPLMVAAPYLFSARGWDSQTNIISILPAIYTNTGTLKYEGSINDVSLNADFTQATIEYKVLAYTTELVDGVYEHIIHRATYFTEIQEIPAGMYYGRDYCVASYYILDSEGSPGTDLQWWYYDLSSGLYPALSTDASIDTSDSILPIVPIRYNNQSMSREDVQDTELYITSKALLGKVGVDIDDVNSELEENPDIDDIDHAYIMFGVDLQTDVVASIRYLAEFFDHISDKGQANLFTCIEDIVAPDYNLFTFDVVKYSSYKAYTGVFTTVSNARNEVSWAASDGSTTSLLVSANSSLGSFQEFGLSMQIDYTYILSEIVEGSIGDVGHAEKSWTLGDVNKNALNGRYLMDDSTLILKVQITENAYKKITVVGLTHRNYIHENNAVGTTLSMVIEDEENYNFIIPIHYNLAKKLPNLISSQLYQDSLVLVLNSVDITKVKWYESSIFKALFTFVGLLLIPFTAGSSAFISALTTASAIGLSAILMVLLENAVIAYAFTKAVEIVAGWVGPEFTLLLAGVSLALSGLAKIPSIDKTAFLSVTMPSSSQLLSLGISLIEGATKELSSMIEEVGKELTAFSEEAELLYDELEDYTDLLYEPDSTTLSILEAHATIDDSYQMADLSPDEFYNLACHIGNPGVLALSSPTTFCDIALTLPTPDT